MVNIENNKKGIEKIQDKPKGIKEKLEWLENTLVTRGEQSTIAKEQLWFDMEKTNTLAWINNISGYVEKFGDQWWLIKIAHERGLC